MLPWQQPGGVDAVLPHLADDFIRSGQLGGTRRQQQPAGMQPVAVAAELLEQPPVSLPWMTVPGVAGVYERLGDLQPIQFPKQIVGIPELGFGGVGRGPEHHIDVQQVHFPLRSVTAMLMAGRGRRLRPLGEKTSGLMSRLDLLQLR